MSKLTQKLTRENRISEAEKRISEAERRAAIRNYAVARLWEWGNCVRTITMSRIPNRNYYSAQSWAMQRENFEFTGIEAQDYNSKRWIRAIETDEALLPIRETNVVYWQAIVIRYVVRQPGGVRKLPQKIQLRQFAHTTGQNKTTYYKALSRVEEYLAFALVGVDDIIPAE